VSCRNHRLGFWIELHGEWNLPLGRSPKAGQSNIAPDRARKLGPNELLLPATSPKAELQLGQEYEPPRACCNLRGLLGSRAALVPQQLRLRKR
jgi:hypothetical protein